MQTRLRPLASAYAGQLSVSPDPATPALIISRAVSVVGIIAVAMRPSGPWDISLGTILSVALIPCWWSSAMRYRGAKVLMALVLLAIGAGAWLSVYSSSSHQVLQAAAITWSTVALDLATGVGLILWGRELMSDAHVAQWFGIGLVLGIDPGASLFSSNPWRFGFSIAVTVLVLALVQQTNKRWLELITLLTLSAVSALTDARSSFAMLLLAALFVAWQMRPIRSRRRLTFVEVMVGVAVAGVVVFNLGQAAILDGYLGEQTQSRTQSQIDTSGSLILGGRPELGATLALMSEHPLGFGSGTLPSSAEVSDAKAGMASIGYDPNNGYVENYMFGHGFELHSLVGDLWAHFGIPGVALAAGILVFVVSGLARRLAANAASGLLLYLSFKAIWNVAFSPLLASVALTVLGLGLVLTRIESRAAAPE